MGLLRRLKRASERRLRPARRLPRPRWHEALEPRILLDADPVATITTPAEDAPIGETATIGIELENQDPTDTGFLPFVNLFVDTTGPDGAPMPDGLTFDDSSFLGGPLTFTELTLDAAGQATHPLIGTVITAPAAFGEGDTLIVFEFPLGSFAPGQSVDFTVDLDISNLADIGTPLNVAAQGGFALGCDEFDNPGVDPPIFGAVSAGTVTPTLIDVTKAVITPEDEVATGPNNPITWEITIDIADGQTIEDFRFEDFLPPDQVYLGNLTVAGAAGLTNADIVGGTLTQPGAGTGPFDPPASEISFELGDVIGTVAETDVVISFDAYVNDVDASGAPVLPAGGDDASTNTATVTGNWDPIDARDADIPINESDSQTLEQSALVIRKGVSIVSDPDGAGLSAGDTLQYTLTIDISDFFTVADLVITDFLGDGQSFDAGFTPTFSVSEQGVVTAGSFDLIDTGLPTEELSTTPNDANGIETLVFDLSQALVNEGVDDLIAGGLVNGGAFGESVATIVFQATVDGSYVGPVAGNASVSQGDTLSNATTVDGTIRDNTTGAFISNQSDDSGTTLVIATGALSKDLYAVNGTVGAPGTNLQVGDTLTYRLIYALPLTEFEGFVIDDFLSQPILDLGAEPVAFALGGGDPPPAGTATYGPGDTSFAITGITPTLTALPGNILRFDFGDFDPAGPTPSTVELLFTMTIQDAEFADQLPLSNQATATEANTESTPVTEDAIVAVTLSAPELEVRKGVVTAIENAPNLAPGLAFDGPVAPGGVAFQDPGIVAGAAFTGTISSANLGTTLDANASGLDAGDLVKFVIVVENVGNDDAFDVVVDDTIPAGFVVPGIGANGINLKVTDGAGNPFPGGNFSAVVGAGTIEVTLDDGASGSIQDVNEGVATPGSNIAIITYDLEVANVAAAPAGETLTNTATVDEYAAIEGGIDRSDDPMDPASVTLSDPTIAKAVVSTSQAGTGTGQGDGALEDLTIGESVTFELVVTVPEGTQTTFTVTDLLPVAPGILEVTSATVDSIGASISGGVLAAGAAGTLTDTQLADGFDDTVTFDFTGGGATPIVNTPDGTIDADDQIRLLVTAVVRDVPANTGITQLTNTGQLAYDNGTVSDTADVEVVEPVLEIDKASPTTSGDAGDTVTYTIRVTHGAGSSAPAYDLSITDPLVAGITVVGGTLNAVSSDGASVVTVNSGSGAGDTIDIDVSELGLGETVTITFDATIDQAVTPGQTITNTADVDWDSLPGVDPLERDGNDDDPHTVTVDVGTFDKSIFTTSRTDTGSNALPAALDFHDAGVEDLAIGETVTYRLTYTMPETTDDVTIVDDLPDVLSVVSSEVISLGAITGSALAVGAAGTATDVNLVDGFDDRVTFAFGTLTNTADGVVNADDQIVVEVVALVRNVDPANVDGQLKTNTGTVSFTGGTLQDTSDLNIVEPLLDIDKSVAPTTGDAGDTVTYTIEVEHEAASTLNAYDLSIVDALVAGITVTGGTLNVVSTDGASVVTVNSGNVAGDTIDIDVSQLALGETLTITFDATLDATVTPLTTYTNTVDLDYDNAPGADPNQRAEADDDDATVTTSAPSFSKGISATSVAQTGSGEGVPANPDLVVGEIVDFELVFVVPEGTTSSLVITDNLPTVNGVLAHLSNAVTSFGSGNLVSSNGLGVGSAGVVSDVNLVDGFDDRVVFDFGQVTNAADNVLDGDDEIRIRVTAVVVDLPANADGDTLTNTATVDFGTGMAMDTADVDIVEPLLTIDKSVLPTTVSDAGDVVTYTIEVEHDPASTATAFDLSITDGLDPNLVVQAGTLMVASTDGASVVTINSGSGAGDTIDIDVSELAVGETVTITFDVAIGDGVEIDEVIPNQADLAWDSNPGPGGRPGTDDDPADVTVNGQPTFTKSIVATSRADTGTGQFTPLDDLAIGETVTYELEAILPEGTIDSLILTDDLPTVNGVLSVVSSQVTVFGANLSSSNGVAVGTAGVPADVNLVDGLDDRVVFDFGTVVNSGDNIAANDRVVVQIVALVEDLPANVAGDVLTNTGTLDFTTAGLPGQLMDTEQVEIVEPLLTIDKAASTTDLEPGEVFTYTLTIEHDPASTLDAFDLQITDLIVDPAISLVPTTVGVVGGTGVTVVTGNGAGDTTVSVTVDELDLGTTLTITYDVQVDAAAPLATTIDNTADLAWDNSPGADPNQRGGADQDMETARTRPELVKSISATDLGDTALQVGETVTYELTLTIGEGDSILTLTDDLPDVLTVVSSQVTAVGADIAGIVVGQMGVLNDVNFADGLPDQVVYAFGAVTNTPDGAVDAEDQVTVEVVARVADVPQNVDGNTDLNTATLAFEDPGVPGSNGTTMDDATTTIVEPVLQIDKATSSNMGDAGDILTFTLTIDHTVLSTGDAYDVVITDLLADANLALQPGTVMIVTAPAGGANVDVGNGGADTTLQVSAPSILMGETLVIQYDAQVLITAEPLDVVTNQADLVWDSFPGPGGRAGMDDDGETFTVDGPEIDKVVSGSTETGTSGSDLFIGETVFFDVTITLPEGTNPTVVLTDLLPPLPGPGALQYLSSQVLFVGANLMGSTLLVGDPGTPSDMSGNGVIDTVTFDFTAGGAITNTPDGIDDVDDTIRVRVTALVPNGFGNRPGDQLTNTAEFDFGSGVITDTETIRIVPRPPPPVGVGDAPPTLFDFYATTAFDDFLGDRPRIEAPFGDELYRPLEPLLTVDPLYSGTAEPGATLEVKIFNPFGEEIGTQAIVVDAGGNWVARFPAASLYVSSYDDEFARLDETRLFGGRDGLFEDRDLFGSQRRAEASTNGTVLRQQPHSLRVAQTRPSFHDTDEAGQNRRTYFTPAVNDLHFVERPISIDRVFEERASHGVDLAKRAAERPVALGWNKYDDEFLGEPGHPAGR